MTRDEAGTLDAKDPLSHFRSRFHFPDRNLIYLDGNSLGRLPINTAPEVDRHLNDEWGDRLIRGWNEGWMELPFRLGDKIGQLIGAQSGETVVADSTSVNLFKLAAAACLTQRPRTKIVTDDLNFPSDHYVLQGLKTLLPSLEIVVIRSSDGVHGPVEELVSAIDDQTAVVTLSHTVFKSGFVYDMAPINRRARQVGALTLWDLSHSVGSVPVNLGDTGADLAVGCTYKYLNGGPGSPAFLYVNDHHQRLLANPVSGWMGQTRPFDFELTYQGAPGITHFLTGTPSVVALKTLEPGLDVVLEAGMPALRSKSLVQTEALRTLWENRLQGLGFAFNSPQDAECRGSHVSLGHAEAYRIDLALINEMGVLPDFRAPDNIRIGIAPLYTRHVDVVDAVDRLCTVVESKAYEKYSRTADGVT